MTTTPTFVIGNPDVGEWLASFHHCGRVATFTNDKASAKRFTCPKGAPRYPPVWDEIHATPTAARDLYRPRTGDATVGVKKNWAT